MEQRIYTYGKCPLLSLQCYLYTDQLILKILSRTLTHLFIFESFLNTRGSILWHIILKYYTFLKKNWLYLFKKLPRELSSQQDIKSNKIKHFLQFMRKTSIRLQSTNIGSCTQDLTLSRKIQHHLCITNTACKVH